MDAIMPQQIEVFPWNQNFATGIEEIDEQHKRLVELLKQSQYKPMSVEQEVMVVYAGTKGFLDDVAIARVQEFQDKFLAYVDQSYASLRSGLLDKKDLAKGWTLACQALPTSAQVRVKFAE